MLPVPNTGRTLPPCATTLGRRLRPRVPLVCTHDARRQAALERALREPGDGNKQRSERNRERELAVGGAGGGTHSASNSLRVKSNRTAALSSSTGPSSGAR